MKQPVVGRGDLIRSLAAGQLSDQAVALLGFEPSETVSRPNAAQDQDQRRGAAGGHADDAQAGSSWPPATQFEPLPTLFWRLDRLEVADDQSEAKSQDESDRSREVQVARDTSQPASRGEDDSTTRPLELLPLATSAELRSRVRHLSALRGASNELDIPAAVERIARETVVFDLPRRQHVTLGRLHVVEDRAEHLIPYWLDQDLTTELLRTFYPADDLCVARIEPGRLEPAVRWPRPQMHRDGWPEPGVTLLVLGDLGCLNNATDYWLQVGRRMRKQGSAAIALVPCRREEVPDDVWRWWQVIPWESSPAGASSETALGAVQLTALLALTIRLEPGLLRSVRRALPGGAGNPGLESRVWSDRAIASPHPLGATWNSEQLKPLRQIVESVPSQFLALVWSEIDRWHARLSKSIGHAEVLALDCVNPDVCRSVVGDGRRREAVSYVQAAAQASGGLPTERKDWLSLLIGWMPDTVQDAELREAFSRLVDVLRPPGPLAEIPPYYIPPPDKQDEPRTVAVVQHGGRLTFTPRSATEAPGLAAEGSGAEQGSPVALITSTNDLWTLEAGGSRPDFQRPAWASEIGRDRFGHYAAFRCGDVMQRMRWIPAGSFLMGSPESEQGDSDERPRHRVTLSCGFWMFDTPCTQELWRAVMGDDPSRFKGPRRPVEQVSWRDVQTFLAKFNERLPELRLVLPTEAQWEYACRAGSQEARYGELDQIAWHDGNSGNETHSVGQKAPNDWGLYDMLGNVYEWCQDHAYRPYQDREERDPLYRTDNDDALRVSRGGDWDSPPQGVRAAYRLASRPGDRWSVLGFRAVSSGEPSQDSGAGPHRIDAQRSGAEPVSVPAQQIDWKRADGPVPVTLPDRPVIRIHTRRRETWTLARIEPPAWAAETGRDRFGLWADFTLEGVTQRMRWIPPGRFMMGSPPDDTERFEFEMEAHAETVEQGFWIFDTPCRQVLWSSVRSDNPSRFKGEQRPVESVTWDEAVEFLKVLGQRVGLALVLPSERQWEYACRAGSTDSRYGPLDAIAWHDGNSGGQTQEVALKQPNAWGLYDMLGNVYEWCLDRHGDAFRVYRGGRWLSAPRGVRAAYRDASLPGNRWNDQGFRAVSSGEPSQGSGAGPNRIDAQRSGAEPSSVPAERKPGKRAETKRRGRKPGGGAGKGRRK